MQDQSLSPFETFLVQDVILTLGNLRQSLLWLDDENSLTPAAYKAGIQRLHHQLGLLEDRARDVCRALSHQHGDRADTGPLPLRLGPESRIEPLEDRKAIFRSRRHA
ncbi:MAG: hypothetical protein WBA91_06510 [Paracoccaceae bacterium]